LKIVDHRDTPVRGRKYCVHYGGWEKDHDHWKFLGKSFENIDRTSVQAYEDLLAEGQAHTAQTYTTKSETTVETAAEHRIVIPLEGKTIERPVLHISRATHDYEVNYLASELELACLNWVVTVRLRQYLDGAKFTVITDHSAINEMLNSSPNTAYSLRLDKFRMSLMPFIDNMTIVYRPGKSIPPHVDCISRARYITGRDKALKEGDRSAVASGSRGPGPCAQARQGC